MIDFIIILHKSRSAAAVAGASSPCDSLLVLVNASAAAAALLGFLEASTAASADTALPLVLRLLLVALGRCGP